MPHPLAEFFCQTMWASVGAAAAAADAARARSPLPPPQTQIGARPQQAGPAPRFVDVCRQQASLLLRLVRATALPDAPHDPEGAPAAIGRSLAALLAGCSTREAEGEAACGEEAGGGGAEAEDSGAVAARAAEVLDGFYREAFAAAGSDDDAVNASPAAAAATAALLAGGALPLAAASEKWRQHAAGALARGLMQEAVKGEPREAHLLNLLAALEGLLRTPGLPWHGRAAVADEGEVSCFKELGQGGKGGGGGAPGTHFPSCSEPRRPAASHR